ncbi:hypothetical protein [Micromonospora zamorensis]|uniref:hypothetical protein n=1 Tax=Micromonospora zamorensis TaxID=709883 RepID=UPI003CED0C9C
MTTTVDNAHPTTGVVSTLGTVIDDVIRPQATTVDREGIFPRHCVDALTAGVRWGGHGQELQRGPRGTTAAA